MRRSVTGLLALATAASLAMTACGSSKSSSSSGTTTNSSGSGSGKAQVGVILPDTTSSTRYTLYDAPQLKAAFDAAGVKSDIQNAGGSTAKASQIADAMIGEGVKVILLDSIDATNG